MSLILRGLPEVPDGAQPPREIRRALARDLPGRWLFANCDRELDRRARERRERGEMPVWLGKDGEL